MFEIKFLIAIYIIAVIRRLLSNLVDYCSIDNTRNSDL